MSYGLTPGSPARWADVIAIVEVGIKGEEGSVGVIGCANDSGNEHPCTLTPEAPVMPLFCA
jgi:hypothetical protein